mmetsp:Transcript_22217/g.32435  ORF Transcript_22217/g.32435 Transcript_22217/m.32435 type:complete len:227 (+) Transcript_22217:1410-2090(+)
MVELVREVRLCEADGILPHLGVRVHLHGFLRLLGVDVQLLGGLEVLLLSGPVTLGNEHVRNGSGFECLGHTHGLHPVLLVQPHVNCFFGLASLDKLVFGFFEALLVLQVQRFLEVDFRNFLRKACPRKIERMVEVVTLDVEVNCLFNEAEACQQFGTGFSTDGHRPSVCDAIGCSLATVEVSNTDSLVPLVVGAVHVHGAHPLLGLGVVVLGFFHASFHLQLLRKV